MIRIHPTAIIDPRAELDSSVKVGAYSLIGPKVSIGEGSKIGPHTVIEGNTTIGRNNSIFQFGSIGAVPQDKKYAGESTRLEIGDKNTIREFATLNLGTIQGGGVTRITDNNWVMAYTHIAHDCYIGSNNTIANNTTLAGHVHIGDYVLLSGFTTVHQFCRIGSHAMTAFTTAVSQDIPPFVTAAGNRAKPVGINSEGLRRLDFSNENIIAIKRAYRIIYRSHLALKDSISLLGEQESRAPKFSKDLRQIRNFIESSTRGIIR